MGVQNSPILEVALGLVLIYLIFGFICTAANELVAQLFRLRADTLWGAVRSLLSDPSGTGAARDLYNHHLIRALAVRNGARVASGGSDPNTRSKPSYIPPSFFSLALVEMILGADAAAAPIAPISSDDLASRLGRSSLPADVQQALLPLLKSAGGSVDAARKNIEDWYDAAMERATGWYKQRIQGITLFVAFLAVFLANADTLMLADRLWANPAERTVLAQAARDFKPILPANDASTAESDASRPISAVKLSSVPPAAQSLIGWVGPFDSSSRAYSLTEPRRFPRDPAEWLYKLLGLLLTAFAASLGAPFWFDILNKIVSIRSSGPSPNDAPRQPARRPDPATRVGSPAAADAAAPAESATAEQPVIAATPQ